MAVSQFDNVRRGVQPVGELAQPQGNLFQAISPAIQQVEAQAKRRLDINKNKMASVAIGGIYKIKAEHKGRLDKGEFADETEATKSFQKAVVDYNSTLDGSIQKDARYLNAAQVLGSQFTVQSIDQFNRKDILELNAQMDETRAGISNEVAGAESLPEALTHVTQLEQVIDSYAHLSESQKKSFKRTQKDAALTDYFKNRLLDIKTLEDADALSAQIDKTLTDATVSKTLQAEAKRLGKVYYQDTVSNDLLHSLFKGKKVDVQKILDDENASKSLKNFAINVNNGIDAKIKADKRELEYETNKMERETAERNEDLFWDNYYNKNLSNDQVTKFYKTTDKKHLWPRRESAISVRGKEEMLYKHSLAISQGTLNDKQINKMYLEDKDINRTTRNQLLHEYQLHVTDQVERDFANTVNRATGLILGGGEGAQNVNLGGKSLELRQAVSDTAYTALSKEPELKMQQMGAIVASTKVIPKLWLQEMTIAAMSGDVEQISSAIREYKQAEVNFPGVLAKRAKTDEILGRVWAASILADGTLGEDNVAKMVKDSLDPSKRKELSEQVQEVLRSPYMTKTRAAAESMYDTNTEGWFWQNDGDRLSKTNFVEQIVNTAEASMLLNMRMNEGVTPDAFASSIFNSLMNGNDWRKSSASVYSTQPMGAGVPFTQYSPESIIGDLPGTRVSEVDSAIIQQLTYDLVPKGIIEHFEDDYGMVPPVGKRAFLMRGVAATLGWEENLKKQSFVGPFETFSSLYGVSGALRMVGLRASEVPLIRIQEIADTGYNSTPSWTIEVFDPQKGMYAEDVGTFTWDKEMEQKYLDLEGKMAAGFFESITPSGETTKDIIQGIGAGAKAVFENE